MKLVGDFLARFHGLTPPNDSLRRAVAEALSDIVRVRVPSEKITIQNGVAHVQVSSVAKSAIRVRRGEILHAVFENLPKARTSLRDIR